MELKINLFTSTNDFSERTSMWCVGLSCYKFHSDNPHTYAKQS